MDVDTLINHVKDVEKKLTQRPDIKSIAILRKLTKIYINKDGRIFKYPIMIYVGTKRDHIIIPGIYCTCKDYTIHTMSKKRSYGCIHVYASVLAEKERLYRKISISLNDLYNIIIEILEHDFSRTIRRILYKQAK